MQKRKQPWPSSPKEKSLSALSGLAKSKKVTTRALARIKLPSLPLEHLCSVLLGSRFELEVVSVGQIRSRVLNKKYRKKDSPTNILSFPLSKSEGQLVINLFLSRKQATSQHVSYRDYVLYLLVHGMLHLKGYDHGRKMEALEEQTLRHYTTKEFQLWLQGAH